MTADDTHTCALTTTGGVKCWGSGEFGQLGDGTNGDRDPFVVDNATDIPVDVCQVYDQAARRCDEPLSDAAAVSAGLWHTCALTTTGGVKCWGSNGAGQLSVEGVFCPDHFGGQYPCSNTPVDVVGLGREAVAVSAGAFHTCVLTSEGTVQCWGSNGRGQLGNGTTVHSRTPVDVCDEYDEVAQQCAQLLSDIVAIAAGAHHTCAVTTAGGLKCWGYRAAGQLGDGGSCGPYCSVAVDVVGLQAGVAAVSAGGGHTCAVTSTASLKCWGSNLSGQLGDGTVIASGTPVDVGGLAAQIAAVAAGEGHTCALSTAGGVKCWGSNGAGMLGNGTTDFDPHPIPQDVASLSQGVTALAAGGLHHCAVMAGGGAKCWGNQYYGGVGDGGACAHRLFCPVPVDVVAQEPKPTSTPTATPTPQATPTPTATPTPLPGDADCDGRVSSLDALFVLQYTARLIVSLPCRQAADVNHDGNITSIDAALVLQRVAGLPAPRF